MCGSCYSLKNIRVGRYDFFFFSTFFFSWNAKICFGVYKIRKKCSFKDRPRALKQREVLPQSGTSLGPK